MSISAILYSYLIFINILAFLLMGLDKQKARRRKWRIPERTLFLSALLGGSLGAIFGMQLFRHKTKHAAFVIGMPCILAAQIAVLCYLVLKGMDLFSPI